MLWTLASVLLVLWLIGLFTSYTLGGVIHTLLVALVVVLIIRLLQRLRAVAVIEGGSRVLDHGEWGSGGEDPRVS